MAFTPIQLPISAQWLAFARLAATGPAADPARLAGDLTRLLGQGNIHPPLVHRFEIHRERLARAAKESVREGPSDLTTLLAQDAQALGHLLRLDERGTPRKVADLHAERIRPRAYQFGHLADLIAAVSRGEDRALIRAPLQTGKTLTVGIFWEVIRHFFAGKKALFIAPTLDLLSQAIASLEATVPHLRIGRIDREHKDFDLENYDFFVASPYTLIKHLDRIPAEAVGLLVVDEALFGFARTWQAILRHFGFLNNEGQIQKAEGHLLLGLSGDPFSLEMIFGHGATITSPPVPWFEENGFLHTLEGLILPYDPAVTFQTIETGDGENISVPREADIAARNAAQLYRQYGKGGNALYFCGQIADADYLADALNKELGKGTAVALHSSLSQAEVDRVIREFNEGRGPRIIVSVRKLVYGITIRGVGLMVHTYLSYSLRLYGQKVGRPQAVAEGESPRTILNIDMVPAGTHHTPFATLAHYRGVADLVPAGILYGPTNILYRKRHSPQRPRLFAPYKSMQAGIRFRLCAVPIDTETPANRISERIQRILTVRFRGDMISMADALAISHDRLDRYLYGAVPENPAELKRIAKALGESHDVWLSEWEADALDVIEMVYPMDRALPKAMREMALFARRVSLHYCGLGPIKSLVNSLGFDQPADYSLWHRIYRGVYTGSVTSLNRLAEILTHPLLVQADLTDPAMVFVLIEDVLETLAERKGESLRTVPAGLGGEVWALSAAEIGGYPVRLPDGSVVAHESLEEGGRTVLPNSMKKPRLLSDLAPDEHTLDAWRGWVNEPHDERIQEDLRVMIGRVLGTLPPREESALRMYFGIDSEKARTGDEIGNTLNLSGTRVHQLIGKALSRLKHPTQSRLLTEAVAGRVPLAIQEVQETPVPEYNGPYKTRFQTISKVERVRSLAEFEHLVRMVDDTFGRYLCRMLSDALREGVFNPEEGLRRDQITRLLNHPKYAKVVSRLFPKEAPFYKISRTLLSVVTAYGNFIHAVAQLGRKKIPWEKGPLLGDERKRCRDIWTALQKTRFSESV